jgi:hypothetical protein
MSTTSSLLKTLLHKTIAEGLYKEVQSRTSRYYYFLGKTVKWEDETQPPYPIDSFQYEKDSRNEMITLKEIKPADVSFTVPRIDWVSGQTYDIYDDNYSTQVQGIDISDGGGGYIGIPTVTIEPPDIFGGVQATATATVVNNQVTGITMVNKGSGYTNPPVVTFSGGGVNAEQAHGVGVLAKSPNGFQKLEDAKFYVMTDEYNVYKCLDNNNNSKSINKPIGTQILPISLADGYIWKYLFNVPIALRTKFLTEDQMPILTALTQQFYSAGGIESTIIESKGTGYTAAVLDVQGDGYLESDPVYLDSINNALLPGTNYVDGDTLTIAQPYETASSWIASHQFALGNKIISSTKNIYEVVQAGTTGTLEPTHKTGTIADGTTSLKYIGTVAKAFPTISGGGITAVNLVGGIREVNLITHGSGYTSNPSVVFSLPSVTFSGTSSAVNTTTEVISIGPHWFSTGDPVVYSNGGGTTIPGLINNTTYYIIKNSSTSIKLASTLANANSGTPINFTGYGVGASHKLTNATNLPIAYTDLSPQGVVKRIIITDSGDNYIAVPSVTIGNAWTASTVVTLGQQYSNSGRLYTVVQAGTTGSTAPNGAIVTKININIQGSGYTSAPTVTISGGGGSNATATSTISSGGLATITVTEGGYGYTSQPTITIGNPWVTLTAVTLGTQLSFGGRLYTVTTAGTTGASGPTHTSGAIANGSSVLTYVGSSATASAVLDSTTGTTYTNGTSRLQYVGSSASATCTLRYGAGYSSPPKITANTSTGTGFSAAFNSSQSKAKLTAVIEDGQIGRIQVDDPGVGYSSATISVSGDGSGAAIIPDISIGNINTLQANNELLTTAGTVDNIQVISHGYAYGTATVSITGDGTGATANVIIVNGKVNKIIMTNRGSGYTYANVVITGNGYAATARAIISPFQGHGKDAYEELFARTLIFYSNVSRDKNQGFDVNNDYRQVGIIKNIREYGKTSRYASASGSACFAIEGFYNTTQFLPDMLLTTTRTVDGVTFYRKFRIVSVNSTGTGMLIQCLDNDPPVLSDVLTNENNQYFSVRNVKAPTVDKYSGDLLFIDNKAGFTPSADETVTLRTVIKF